MRAVPVLLVCGGLLELGWLALWPLSVTLSHSPLFTSAVLVEHPLLQMLLPAWTQATLTDPLGSPTYFGPAILLASLLLYLAGVYALALILLDRAAPRRRRRTLTVILGSAVVFQLTLFAMPGLFSQDVFSYIAYGRLSADYGLNPYIWPPSVVRDPVVAWVAEVWRTYPSPYGPLWLDLQMLLERLFGQLSLADQALVYRAFSDVLLLANLGLVWRLLGRLTPLSPGRRLTSLAALAWNPLVLFEIAGNAHNDVLMITFTLLGLMLFGASSRGTRSTVVLALGVLVKYLSGLSLVWLGLAAAARESGWPRRFIRLAGLTVLALGIAVAIFGPWLELPDSLDPLLNETAGVGYVNALPDTLLMMPVSALGIPVDPARAVERFVILVAFAAYVVWEIRQVWCEPGRLAVAGALGRSSLIYVLLVSTSVQTWYICLPVTVAVTLGLRRRIARLALAYGALAMPALYLNYYLRDLTPGWVFVLYACAPLLVLVPGPFRRGSPQPPARPRLCQPAMPPTPAPPAATYSARVLQPVAATVRRLRNRPATPAR